ncbi:hypothetical protein [Rasiella sp. SM2506]|uniref:hypothetical protein n=1 Tax=Rasiella sp. SM2506 TaxID=3423914 RepID=UPI003D79901E
MKTNSRTSTCIIVALIIAMTSTTVQAQLCKTDIFNREGTVHSVGPATMAFNATSKKVDILFEKTGGQANGHLEITYKCDSCTTNSTELISFDYGEANSTKTVTIDNVKGKRISMRLVNNSSAMRTISYKVTVMGRTADLLEPDANKSPNLAIGQTKETYITKPSCTNRTKVRIFTNKGRAEASIRIWENVNGQWRDLDTGTVSAWKGPTLFEKIYDTNNSLKIEVKNRSTAWATSFDISVEADGKIGESTSGSANNGKVSKPGKGNINN